MMWIWLASVMKFAPAIGFIILLVCVAVLLIFASSICLDSKKTTKYTFFITIFSFILVGLSIMFLCPSQDFAILIAREKIRQCIKNGELSEDVLDSVEKLMKMDIKYK